MKRCFKRVWDIVKIKFRGLRIGLCFCMGYILNPQHDCFNILALLRIKTRVRVRVLLAIYI